MLVIKKCLKKRENFMPIACTCVTKVILLPQTIGFSGSNWQLELGLDYDKPLEQISPLSVY
jgi:hypothetical protein